MHRRRGSPGSGQPTDILTVAGNRERFTTGGVQIGAAICCGSCHTGPQQRWEFFVNRLAWLMVAITGCGGPSTTQNPSNSTTSPPDSEAWETAESGESDPGRVVLRRLNNEALDRTLQTLLVTEVSIADQLPANGSAHGFDNNAAAQIMSELYLETLETAIDGVISDGLRGPVFTENTRYDYTFEGWDTAGTSDWCGDWSTREYGIELWNDNTMQMSHSVEHAGTYIIRLRATNNYQDGATVRLYVNSEDVGEMDVTVECRSTVPYEELAVEVPLEAGVVDVRIDMDSSDDGSNVSVVVASLDIEGPLEADGTTPPGRSKLYICDPEGGSADSGLPDSDCARSIVHNVLDEAWRRPVTDVEVDEVMAAFEMEYSGSGDIHSGIQVAVKRALLSPYFLFMVEVPADSTATTSQPLSAHELATRLSYFLWGRQPDAELRAVADDGTLLNDDVLEAQTRRMLEAPEVTALIEGFGAQWLGLPMLDDATPDAETFPTFDDELRAAMRAEVVFLLEQVLLDDRSMLDLLTAEESWVEPALAAHYGLGSAKSGQLAIIDGRSGTGLLGTAGFLTGTSNPTRTSPVRRGAWVAGNLLCEQPPPPPDGAEEELDESGDAGTIAEQLAAHRADPVCAACHDLIDPIGLSLEMFDGIGTLRTQYDDGTPIETAGDLPGVGAFDNPVELAAALAADSRVARCMTQKLYTYALARGTTASDWPFIEPIEAGFAASGHRFDALVVDIVLSEPFRMHQGEDQ